jgi:hypothetical protein
MDALTGRKEGAVLFADIAAPPVNLLGPELVSDLVSLIQRAEVDNAVKVLVFPPRRGDITGAAYAARREEDSRYRRRLAPTAPCRSPTRNVNPEKSRERSMALMEKCRWP